MDINTLTRSLNSIDIDDLPYIEQDLSYYELVSLGFLLYGGERTTAAFVLQKLLVISNTTASPTATITNPSDLLRSYADKINKESWRPHLIEALAVINARRVLRKLGFQWDFIRQYYLPHISEFSLHIHPMLKALYKICEQLNQVSTGRLILYIDEHLRKPHEHFYFYDSTCLEVFLLDWITRDFISVGNRDCSNANVQILCQYFKLQDLDDLKMILIQTIKNNSENESTQDANTSISIVEVESELHKVQIHSNLSNETEIAVVESSSDKNQTNGNLSYNIKFNPKNCYKISFERAGYALIINQTDFYKETDPQYQHLLPTKKFSARGGSNFDKIELFKTFGLFGYEPICLDNLSHFDMLHCIREKAKLSTLRDSFVVCILSHGCDGAVYGCNSIPVSIWDIEKTFTVEELNEKPKILIVQACQTEETTLNLSKPESSSPIKFADIFKAMSTLSGFPSFRDTSNGSWFIQSLCTKLKELAKSHHFADIMTTVVSDVAKKRGLKESQLPMNTSTLRNFFYLPEKKENN